MRKTLAITHNGVFHADDVLAYVVLRAVGMAEDLRRTRDTGEYAEADIIFDVGGVAGGLKHFDHHQRGGAGVRENGVPFAALGLVWRRYGATYCETVIPYTVREQMEDRIDDFVSFLAEVANLVDETVIQGVDALDNGAVVGGPALKDGTPVSIVSLSGLISSWNPIGEFEDACSERFDDAFLVAAKAIKPMFDRLILGVAARILGRDKVRTAIRACGDKPVLLLEEGMHWKETVVEEGPNIQFVVFPAEDKTWRVQVVPAVLGEFAARRDLPAAWAGLRGKDLAEITGVPDAIFCHLGKFIGGAVSKEGAVKLAELALED